MGKRDQLRSARARFLDVAPLDAPRERDAGTILARVDVSHVDMPARPVIHAGGKQHRGVDRRFHGVQVQPGMQHADGEGDLRNVRFALLKGRKRRISRDAVGDAFVYGPRLVVVSAAADDAKRLPVAPEQLETRLVRR